MPTPITFTLTNAGLSAALDADANGLTLSLTQIAIGSGKYTPLATRTALQTEIARYPLSGGDVEPNSKTLRFSAVLESSITRQAFEVGIFTSTGVLFAVASTTGADPLILATANITFVGAFGMVVSAIPEGSVTVETDPNAALAVALMAQHVAASNPHGQYAMKAAFDGHVSQNAQQHTNLANLISAEAQARDAADDSHVAAANPHSQYAKVDATELVEGIVRLATEAETSAGTSELLATHPKGVRNLVDAYRLTGDLGTIATLDVPIRRRDTGNASQIQVKYGTVTGASGDIVSYLDGAFDNATRLIVVSHRGASGAVYACSADNETATGFTLRHSGGAASITVAYIAIGY